MALADFLAQIGTAMAPQQAVTPGFNPAAQQPASRWEVPLDGGAQAVPGVVLNDPLSRAVQRQQAPAPYEKPSGLRNFLGNLGDALLVGSGRDPMYKPAQERARLGAELAAYLGADDPKLAQIFASNPEAGLKLYNAMREDKRFDRTAGQDDRRIDISEGQLGLGWSELGERARSNQAGEAITQRGQDITSGTQLRLQQLRMQDAQLDRQQRAALQRNDQQFAREIEGMRQQNRMEIARLGGGGSNSDSGTVTETVTYPGEEARTEGGFLGIGGKEIPARPERKVVTKRPANAQQTISQSDLEYTAKKHGISVDEVKRRLGMQ